MAQTEGEVIKIANGSFEDRPRKGGDGVEGIRRWYDCGETLFPEESPPDIHPKAFWENTIPPSHGNTYLGMVVRDNDTYESVSQQLEGSIKGGQCYTLSVDLAQSPKYVSGSRLDDDPTPDENYTEPIILKIFSGHSHCDPRENLANSIPIDHDDWRTYTFKLTPENNARFITLRAFWKSDNLFLPNGHILIDNLSDIKQIPCNEDVAVVEEKKLPPPHKRKRKKPKKVTPEPVEKVVEETIVSATPEKVLNLDRKKIRKGQTIEIKNLYFAADTSSINHDSHGVLDEVFDFLKNNADIIVEIGGHTNGTPSHKYCDRLSTDRAKAVAQYLSYKGIPASRLKYKGYGKRKPIASNRTKMGRKKNQRVEIKILSIG